MADESIVRSIYFGLSSSAKQFIDLTTVRVVLNLALPLRQLLQTFLLRWKASLVSEKDNLVGRTTRLNVVSNSIAAKRRIVQRALEPVEDLSRRIPWQNIAEDAPGLAQILDKALKSIPAAIPQTGIGVDVAEFLEGVRSYSDLKRKAEELTYEAQRVTAIGAKISRENSRVNAYVDEVDAYLELLAAAI